MSLIYHFIIPIAHIGRLWLPARAIQSIAEAPRRLLNPAVILPWQKAGCGVRRVRSFGVVFEIFHLVFSPTLHRLFRSLDRKEHATAWCDSPTVILIVRSDEQYRYRNQF